MKKLYELKTKNGSWKWCKSKVVNTTDDLDKLVDEVIESGDIRADIYELSTIDDKVEYIKNLLSYEIRVSEID